MDAVILAAGKGKRLEPITKVIPKPLLPILDKPLIEKTIEALKTCNVKNIFVIISYKKELFEKFLKEYDVTLITQNKPLGTADALKYVKDYVDDSFLTLFGDCLYSIEDIKNIIQKFSGKPILGVKYSSEAYKYGVLIKEKSRYKIIEKPSNIREGYILTGLNIFLNDIFNYIGRVKKSERGEYELTDAINLAMDNDTFEIYELKHYWKDIGTFMDYMDACFHMLKETDQKVEGEVAENVTIRGKVILEKGAKILPNTYIEGNAYIGKDSTIGPFARLRGNVVIGKKCKIGSFVEIKNSIIFDETNVPHLNYVGDSIIASNCNLGAGTKIANLRLDEKNVKIRVKGKLIDTGKRKFGCVIGFNTKIGINVSINPGRIIGNNCKIGPNVVVYEDLEDNTFILLKQEYLVKRTVL